MKTNTTYKKLWDIGKAVLRVDINQHLDYKNRNISKKQPNNVSQGLENQERMKSKISRRK